MRPATHLCILSLACLLAAQPGRWDHHPTRRSFSRRITTPSPVRTTAATTLRSSRISVPRERERERGSRGGSRAWEHALGWSVPAERCQIPADTRHLPGASGAPLHSYYIDYVNELLVQDKTVVSPIVFEGAMVSRTNTYKNLYFVSFKVFRVLKGHIHQQLQGHIRLLFQTESRRTNYKSKTIKNCPPVPFNVRSGRKYLVFVKNLLSPGRFIAVAKPEVVRRKTMREVKEILSCDYCVSKAQLKSPRSKKVPAGGDLKLKCKVTNKAVPPPAIAWYKDGALLTKHSANIETKKKRSTLTVSGVGARDGGIYTCQATNIAGTSSHATHVSIRNTAPQTHQASSCPIHSYCLNGGSCLYYHSIGELVCRCSEGFTGQRCQFKKAMKFQYPGLSGPGAGCGAYGYDINQLCSAWREAPEEMTKEQYQVHPAPVLSQDQHSDLLRNGS